MILSVLVAQLVGRLGSNGFLKQDYGWGSGYAAILAHAGGALYGTELGSVTLKRIGFFFFPIKHSTHTVAPCLSSVKFNAIGPSPRTSPPRVPDPESLAAQAAPIPRLYCPLAQARIVSRHWGPPRACYRVLYCEPGDRSPGSVAPLGQPQLNVLEKKSRPRGMPLQPQISQRAQ